MFYFVYILYSKKDKRLYVGQTNNLEKRLERHNNGDVRATKTRVPLVLIWSETCPTRDSAQKREKFLKSLWGSREKRKILRQYLLDGRSSA